VFREPKIKGSIGPALTAAATQSLHAGLRRFGRFRSAAEASHTRMPEWLAGLLAWLARFIPIAIVLGLIAWRVVRLVSALSDGVPAAK
jgi:hypothetical protein